MKSREDVMKANRAKLADEQTNQGFAVNPGFPMDNPLYGKDKVAQKSRKGVKSKN
jgi:hypothetical protein